MTAVQWLSIKETGARRLCSIEEAFRLDKIPMDAYDRAAAHKVHDPCCITLPHPYRRAVSGR